MTQANVPVEQMNCEQLCQLMLDKGRDDAERNGYRWDNRHPTYCEIYAAYRADDLAEARRVYAANFS